MRFLSSNLKVSLKEEPTNYYWLLRTSNVIRVEDDKKKKIEKTKWKLLTRIDETQKHGTDQITKQTNNNHLSESQNIYLFISLTHTLTHKNTLSISVKRYRLSVGRSTLMIIINSKCVNLNLDEDVIISISIFFHFDFDFHSHFNTCLHTLILLKTSDVYARDLLGFFLN